MIFFYEAGTSTYRRRMTKMTGKGFRLANWEGLTADANGLPSAWSCEVPAALAQYLAESGGTEFARAIKISRESLEYRIVIDHLAASLDREPQIDWLKRVQIPDAFRRYHAHLASKQDQALMFHGCRAKANQDAIMQEGFRADLCKSSATRGNGTWFAYRAQLSDATFAFSEEDGWKHLFVCLVSKYDLKQDDGQVARVVGQDGAYPQWLVRYR